MAVPRCTSCKRTATEVLLVYGVSARHRRPQMSIGQRTWGPRCWRPWTDKRTASPVGCYDARREKHLARTAHRRVEIPHPDAPEGTCQWCAGRIVHGRVKQRRWHDGREDEPNCLHDYSVQSNARNAVLDLVDRDGTACKACGTDLVKVRDIPVGDGGGRSWQLLHWRDGGEVDHIVPLIDGGTKTLENLQLLCTPCHRAKTAGENSARRRRTRTDQQGNLFDDASAA